MKLFERIGDSSVKEAEFPKGTSADVGAPHLPAGIFAPPAGRKVAAAG
ncbi:hypothetical protein SS05631_c35280 [Sinorhizobium sp. CCBAU 05631]|nr:hypothetical protein SS05631_c35280 [Sinorhizobium sp. CCBAU 05631]